MLTWPVPSPGHWNDAVLFQRPLRRTRPNAIMDIRCDAMAAVGPMIRRLKDGNVQCSIWQEHVCHLVNDEFLRILLETKERITSAFYWRSWQP